MPLSCFYAFVVVVFFGTIYLILTRRKQLVVLQQLSLITKLETEAAWLVRLSLTGVKHHYLSFLHLKYKLLLLWLRRVYRVLRTRFATQPSNHKVQSLYKKRFLKKRFVTPHASSSTRQLALRWKHPALPVTDLSELDPVPPLHFSLPLCIISFQSCRRYKPQVISCTTHLAQTGSWADDICQMWKCLELSKIWLTFCSDAEGFSSERVRFYMMKCNFTAEFIHMHHHPLMNCFTHICWAKCSLWSHNTSSQVRLGGNLFQKTKDQNA